MSKIIERLRGVVIEQRPALQVIKADDEKDSLFYVDPPYLWRTRSQSAKTNGYQHEMTDRDQEGLLKVLAKVEGSVVLSAYDSELYRQMLTGWQTYTKQSYPYGGQKQHLSQG